MNLRPLGYEPNELPDCSTPRLELGIIASFPAKTGEWRDLTAAWAPFAGSSRLWRHSAVASPASAVVGSGRSTSSTKAIGALSPTRNPIFRMRV